MAEEISQRIQKDIRKRAESYTPEWRFWPENPDIGSALAIVYAEMMAGTVRQFSRAALKNRIAFLNELDANILPAVPSHGYVQFSLINEEVEGIEAKAGTTVIANDQDLPDGHVAFETREDIYVTPALVSDLYQICDRQDAIYKFYDRQDMEWEPFTLFAPGGMNLQKHEMYFCCDTLLNIHTEAVIDFSWLAQGGLILGSEFIHALADSNKAVFEYYSSDGWTIFEKLEETDKGLVFHKKKSKLKFEKKKIGERESYWIRLKIQDFVPFSKMSLSCLRLSARCQDMLPDTVFGTGEECSLNRYFPFGERLALYQEVYFGSEEVLSKKGAQVTLSFGIQFVKIPLDTNSENTTNWEWIMKRSDFKQDLAFDVTIESVIWEYYNGSGWTRLFEDDSYQRIFSVPDEVEGQYRSLQFVCPEDIERTIVNAAETFYIRARIRKINNLYKLQGHYVVPCLENTSLRYEYSSGGIEPQTYVFRNNLEYDFLDGKGIREKEFFLPFVQTDTENMGVYLGFEVAPIGNPIKMLFCIANEKDRCYQHLLWEYWDGKCWKNVNLIDETDHFSKTGIVTFAGNADMKKKRLFGKERYWFRIRDIGNYYLAKEAAIEPPVLQQIHMNTTTVQNVYRREREYFQMEMFQEGKSFKLLENNVYTARVFVDETGNLSEEELADLKKEELVFIEEDADGMPERIWVEWKQVPDFSESDAKDRHFVLRAFRGELIFGDGKHGRISYVSRIENICIDYCSGGGEYTNLEAGKINRLDRSNGYISEVINPGRMTGGCDAETLEEAVKRASAAIRHQNRAVSARDYEELAMCASRDIQLAKCFAGYDVAGRRASGAVTLVILPKQFRYGQMNFAPLKEKVMQCMKDSVSTFLLDNRKFFVVHPEFIEVRLYIELSVKNFNEVFRIKKEILERLERFLSPAGKQGSEGGWEIGKFPNTMQVQNAISDIRGIVYIRNIMMSAYTADSVRQEEVDIEKIRKHRYVLPVNGEHEIIMKVESR